MPLRCHGHCRRRFRPVRNRAGAPHERTRMSLKRRPHHDIRPRFGYIYHRISLNYRTAAGDPGCPERVRFPRAGARHLCSRAANGKTPGRHYDRSATLSLDWDRSPSGNARRRPRPRKRVLELSGGVGSRPQVLRWNADRRARMRSARDRMPGSLRRLRKLVCVMRAEGYASVGVSPS